MESEYIKDIAIGQNHYCFISPSERLICFGDEIETSLIPENFTNKIIRKLSVGFYHTCALAFRMINDNAYFKCWGSNQLGQIDIPEAIATIGEINIFESGPYLTCVQKNNYVLQLKCWGQGINDQMEFEVLDDIGYKLFKYLKIGLNNAICGVADRMYCWGDCTNGICEISEDERMTHFVINNLEYQYSIGKDHSCLVIEGIIKCYGGNSDGQLEITKGLDEYVKSVATGNYSTCILRYTNQIKCYGIMSKNQINIDNSINYEFPDYINHFASLISAGDRHTCARLNGSLKCIGNNDFGQLDVPSTIINNASMLSSNWDYSCSILLNNNLACWGFNQLGQTDFQSHFNSYEDSKVIDVSTGLTHACAVSNTRNNATKFVLYCWGGHNEYQELDPPKVPNVKGVAVGEGFTCLWTDVQGPNSYCYGRNDFGQTNLPNQLKNKTLKSLNTVITMSLGSTHGCSVNSNKIVYCWGSDSHGQLVYKVDFMLVRNKVDYIVAQGFLTCALVRIGKNSIESKVYCWGEGYNRGRDMELGEWTWPQGLSLGYGHQCVWGLNGRMQCQGEDEWGQINWKVLNIKD